MDGHRPSPSQTGDATSHFQSPESPSVMPDKWPSLLEGTRPYFSAGADTSVSSQVRVREWCPNSEGPGEGGCPGPCCFWKNSPVFLFLSTCEVCCHPFVKMSEKVKTTFPGSGDAIVCAITTQHITEVRLALAACIINHSFSCQGPRPFVSGRQKIKFTLLD